MDQDMHPDTKRLQAKKGYLLITAGQNISTARLTSVACNDAYVGNGWMPVPGVTPDQARAAAVFLNSTIGRLQIMRKPGKILTFPNYSAKEVANIRVPDLKDEGIVRILSDCWKRTSTIEVPQYKDGEHEVRRLWDEATAEAMGRSAEELAKLRELLHREPLVRQLGYNQYDHERIDTEDDGD